MFKAVDHNRDGWIDYKQFSSVFVFAQPKLSERKIKQVINLLLIFIK